MSEAGVTETAMVRPVVSGSDWKGIVALAIDAVTSTHTKRAYQGALGDFVAWYREESRLPLGIWRRSRI